MKRLILEILVLCGMLISCGGNVGNASKGVIQPPKLDLPTPPALVAGRDVNSWLTEHFWDNMNPSDTTFKSYPDNTKEILRNWSAVMQGASFSSMHKGVKNLMEKVKHDSATVKHLMFVLEDVFFDPTLPFRNFEAYTAVLEWVVDYDQLSEDEKMRPRSQLEMIVKNRIGSLANNFTFITLDNNKHDLYKVGRDFTLIFINDPLCPSCREYKEMLSQDDFMNDLIQTGVLKVIGVVTDDDEKLWRDHAYEFPKNWVNGFNKDLSIKNQRSYDLTVIPTLILIDKSKQVLLKDVDPRFLLEFLHTIG